MPDVKDVEMHTAHRILHKALRCGKIEKAEACSHCGSDGRIVGHHENYADPLGVKWLCYSCHNRLHRLGLAGAAARVRAPNKRIPKTGRRKQTMPGVSRVINMPRDLHALIHKDAAAHYQTFSQWIRDAAVKTLRQRGALPKK